jgi:hypothetical protein
MTRSRGALLAAACAALLGACGGGGSGPPPTPSPDTLWLAPNGSEVVLKLVDTQPTVPF